jgi:hypothetical protein
MNWRLLTPTILKQPHTQLWFVNQCLKFTIASKRNCNKKEDKTDLSVITVLELLECLSAIILTLMNIEGTDLFLKKPKIAFSLKKILNKLYQNLKPRNIQKSEQSWNVIFDMTKNQDWSTTSFTAQRAEKLEDLFVLYAKEHTIETRQGQSTLGPRVHVVHDT